VLFTTIEFLIFFIAVLSIIAIFKKRLFLHIFLLGASYFFFYWTSNYLILLIIFITVWTFYLAQITYNTKNKKIRKILFVINLGGNLGLLGFYKYTDFAITQFNILGNYIDLATNIPLLNLALPVGISFYTFHSVGYVIDVYRGHISPSKSIREYALFITFFPLLVSGPILRAKEFLPQLREKIDNFEVGTKIRLIALNETNLRMGITLIGLGFFKKMFFADNISPMVTEIFAMPYGLDSFTIILGTIGFGIQIYCDFSGYSDIAIGSALIMGFKIPSNFNHPFFSTSPSEYWRRWHISLSSWVKDYLFLPIVYRRIGSDLVLFGGMLLSFILLGLWHGAGWNFIFFGFLHGIYVTVEIIIRKRFPRLAEHPFFQRRIGIIFSIIATQYLVFFAFIAFRSVNTESMIYSMEKFLIWDFQIQNTIGFIKAHKIESGLICLFVILNFISFRLGNQMKRIASNNYLLFSFLTVIVIVILFLYGGHSEDFIYFEF